jgi:D-galactarolactone cycloisomerase
LRKLLHTDVADRVPACASRLNPGDGPETVVEQRALGHRNFKLKIGFGDAVDKDNVRRIIDGLSTGERFFVDANQKWDLDQAITAAEWLVDAGVGWLAGGANDRNGA